MPFRLAFNKETGRVNTEQGPGWNFPIGEESTRQLLPEERLLNNISGGLSETARQVAIQAALQNNQLNSANAENDNKPGNPSTSQASVDNTGGKGAGSAANENQNASKEVATAKAGGQAGDFIKTAENTASSVVSGLGSGISAIGTYFSHVVHPDDPKKDPNGMPAITSGQEDYNDKTPNPQFVGTTTNTAFQSGTVGGEGVVNKGDRSMHITNDDDDGQGITSLKYYPLRALQRAYDDPSLSRYDKQNIHLAQSWITGGGEDKFNAGDMGTLTRYLSAMKNEPAKEKRYKISEQLLNYVYAKYHPNMTQKAKKDKNTKKRERSGLPQSPGVWDWGILHGKGGLDGEHRDAAGKSPFLRISSTEKTKKNYTPPKFSGL